MRTIKFKRIIYMLMFFSPLLLISCEKETETKVPLSRLFRPVSLTATIDASKVVTFTWTPVGDGVYSLEMSRDSLLFTTDLLVFTIENKLVSDPIGGLLSNTTYSARVKAISKKNASVEDSGYKEITFKTGI